MICVGIVCGYDLDDDLDRYVEAVRPLIARQCPDWLVFSGGRTSPHSFSSEAWVMASALGEIVPRERVLLEEHAMTTLENLVFARGLAEELCEHIGHFVVFCDDVHKRKVTTLARFILGRQTIVHSVARQAPLRVRLFEPLSHLVEATAALVPPLRHLLRAIAVRLKGVTGDAPRSARPSAASNAGLRRRLLRTSGKADRPRRARRLRGS